MIKNICISLRKIGFGSLIISIIASLFLIVVSTEVSAAPAPWEGSGSVYSPYKIADCEDLYQVGQLVDSEPTTYRNKHYRQIADINCASWDYNTNPFIPIGSGGSNWESYFVGVYDGQGFIINGLTVSGDNSDSIGLFGYAETSTIKNVRIVDAEVSIHKSLSNQYNYAEVGILIGSGVGTRIENVSVSGTVTVTSDVSGNRFTAFAGGLVGTTAYNDIRNSYADANISVTSGSTTTDEWQNMIYAGGLAGQLYGKNVYNSYGKGSIAVNGARQQNVGGFTGSITYENGKGGSVTNSFSAVDVLTTTTDIEAPTNKIGSFIGERNSNTTLSGSYALTVNNINPIGDGGVDGVTSIEFDEPGIEYFYNASNPPMDNWCFEVREGCEVAIWEALEGDTPFLVQPALLTDASLVTGTIRDDLTDELITSSLVELTCSNGDADWSEIKPADDGIFEFSAIEMLNAMNEAGCAENDALRISGFGYGWNRAPEVVATLDYQGGTLSDWVNEFVDTEPAYNFRLKTPAQIEDEGPNDGDANNDAIADSEQDNVQSFISPLTGEYVVLEVDESCYIEYVGLKDQSYYETQDDDYNYPVGLMDFELYCDDEGFTTSVKQYYYGVTGEFTVRKHNPNNGQYWTINQATVLDQTIGGESVKVASYQITDGGELDLDGEADNYIIDPAGMGQGGSVQQTGSGNSPQNIIGNLAKTGSSMKYVLLTIGASVIVGSATLIGARIRSSSK